MSNQEQQPPVVEHTSSQCSKVMNALETQISLEEEDSHTSITSDPFTNVTADNSPEGPTVIWPLPAMEELNFIWGKYPGRGVLCRSESGLRRSCLLAPQPVPNSFRFNRESLHYRAGTPISGLRRWFKPWKCSNGSMHSGTDLTTTKAKLNQQKWRPCKPPTMTTGSVA